MVNEFRLKELKADMMGYKVTRSNDYSFHHLLIPKRDCRKERIPSDGYVEWNGAILSTRSAHPYLHIIERFDRSKFEYITKELKSINEKGYVDVDNLRRIYDKLLVFEQKYGGEYTRKGKKIIKDAFKERFDLDDEETCEKIEEVKQKILTLRK